MTEKATADRNAYYRKYREDKGDHLRRIEKVRYWKTKGLSEQEIDKYGEYAGEVFKIKNILKNLPENLAIPFKKVFSEKLEN